MFHETGQVIKDNEVEVIYATEGIEAMNHEAKKVVEEDTQAKEAYYASIKGAAIAAAVDNLFSQYEEHTTWKNLLSVGDCSYKPVHSKGEENAVLHSNVLKMPQDNPNPEEYKGQPYLAVRLDLIRNWLPHMVQLDVAHDLSLEPQDFQPSTIAKIESELKFHRFKGVDTGPVPQGREGKDSDAGPMPKGRRRRGSDPGAALAAFQKTQNEEQVQFGKTMSVPQERESIDSTPTPKGRRRRGSDQGAALAAFQEAQKEERVQFGKSKSLPQERDSSQTPKGRGRRGSEQRRQSDAASSLKDFQEAQLQNEIKAMLGKKGKRASDPMAAMGMRPSKDASGDTTMIVDLEDVQAPDPSFARNKQIRRRSDAGASLKAFQEGRHTF